MANDWLTAALVEDIQQAVRSDHPIDSAVRDLRGASLPGIMEYGCLRWASNGGEPPPLPVAVVTSTLGRALSAVESALGIRSDGQVAPPLRRLDPQPVEFFSVGNEEQLTSEAWNHFEIRFNRSAQSVGFSKLVSGSLQGALREMADNAVIHSCASIPALAGYRVLDGMAQFCVADVGGGILQSLQRCPDFQHLQMDTEAIQQALRDGVSCFGRNRGGFGFRAVFKALTANWGHLRFRSGTGCITMDGSGLDADQGTVHFPPLLPGFQVTVSCRTSSAAPGEPLV